MRRVFGSIAACLALAMTLGMALGLVMNFVNGVVSPEYFDVVLRRADPPLVVALRHGLAEGAIYGLVFGVLLLLVVLPGRWRTLRPADVVRPVIAGLIAAAACVALGGLAGLCLGLFAPTVYEAVFPIVRRATNLPAFGWVGGSITGAQFGIIVSAVTAAAVCYLTPPPRRRGFAVRQPSGSSSSD